MTFINRKNVNPRVKKYCFECGKETIQWLWAIRIDRGRGCFSSKKRMDEYVCTECGETWH